MTEHQQRNADIAKAVEHALNQKDIDAREWERQSKQWEAVADQHRARADGLERERAADQANQHAQLVANGLLGEFVPGCDLVDALAGALCVARATPCRCCADGCQQPACACGGGG